MTTSSVELAEVGAAPEHAGRRLAPPELVDVHPGLVGRAGGWLAVIGWVAAPILGLAALVALLSLLTSK
jgi:hypothetical protein